ncbi:MAG: hypothetical protein EKK42_20110 [Pseudonocardiaceae bacterium]|nr:MAG: hypothetical protein EKK42_20110 [Pseudonocardiaceae bacterium]
MDATAEQVARVLYVDPEDVRYLVSEMIDLDDELIPSEYVGELHRILDPHGERTVPGWSDTSQRGLTDEDEI